MAETTSLAWPKMFDISGNRVAVMEDGPSVVNRTKLLILTEPTELYNNLNQGVGLKQYLYQYNTDNTKAIIKDRIVEQLRLHEPCVVPDETSFADGLIFTGSNEDIKQQYSSLKMTVAVETTFGDTLNVSLNTNTGGGTDGR